MAEETDIKLGKKDEDALTLVMDRFRTYLSYAQENYHPKWDDYYMQYRSIIDNEAEYPYMARLFIPYSFVSIETTLPRMVETIFASDPIVAAKPQNEEDIPKAEVNQKLLNYQYRRMNYLNTYMMSVKDATIIGSCINMVDWREESRTKKRIAQEEFTPEAPMTESPVGMGDFPGIGLDPTMAPELGMDGLGMPPNILS